ncbi:MAG TPA: protein-tyrosine-phosphatase [Kiloniellales bacterium]|nr:protein-tyrosine-phosphatase [Kiloniellales bacterium]
MEQLITEHRLRVCGLHELNEHCADRPAHVVSILDPGTPRSPHLDGFGQCEIHRFDFHDVIDPSLTDRPPQEADVAELLSIGERALPQSRDVSAGTGCLLIHCYMGVSRSTAALTIMMAARHQGPEAELFDFVRQVRPQAWPNLLMIRYADRLLSKEGRLEAALVDHYRYQAAKRPDLAEAIGRLGRHEELRLAGVLA